MQGFIMSSMRSRATEGEKMKFRKGDELMTRLALREKCTNTESFLVRIFLHSDWIQENTDQK